jgi:phosphoribosylformylglycinamidine synthase
VARDKLKELKRLFAEHEVPVFVLGDTVAEPRLRMNNVIDLPISAAKSAWKNGLRERLL